MKCFGRANISMLMLLCLLPLCASSGEQRTYLHIVGSGIIHPFSRQVTERFVERAGFEIPMMQATGTGPGFKRFCSGVGPREPDMLYASRRMKAAEYDRCHANGVDAIVEIKIGYDGLVLAGSKEMPVMFLGRDDIYRGLAQSVPAADGKPELLANPFTTWKAANAALPRRDIRVLGPAVGSTTYDVFTCLAIEAGCRSVAWLRDLKKNDPPAYRDACRRVRDDTAYLAVDDADETTLEMLLSNPQALAVFSMGFMERNQELIHAMAIDGVLPTVQTVADDSYPLSRPLYLYVKKQHIGRFPGIPAFIAEFTSEHAWGDTGYLAAAGLVPMRAGERQRYSRDAAALKLMARP